MSRSQSIVWFTRLYLASAILGFVATLAFYPTLRAWSVARDSSPGAILIVAVFDLVISLVLWFFVARRASSIAKWLLVGGVLIGLANLALGIRGYLEIGLPYLVTGVLLTMLKLVACGLLFRSDALGWFRNRGQKRPDPAEFD